MTWCKACVCCRSLGGIVGSNLAAGTKFQRSPAECGVSQCESEVSLISRPWPTKCFCAMDTQSIISDAAIVSVVYDINFELKQSQLLIKFTFICLNNLKFIENRKVSFKISIVPKFGLCWSGRLHHYPEFSYATAHNKYHSVAEAWFRGFKYAKSFNISEILVQIFVLDFKEQLWSTGSAALSLAFRSIMKCRICNFMHSLGLDKIIEYVRM